MMSNGFVFFQSIYRFFIQARFLNWGLTVLLFILLGSKIGYAQNRQANHSLITPQEADSLRIDVINRELHLNADESKNFWPIYDEYLSKLQEIQKNSAKENAADRKNIDLLNSNQLNKLISRDFEDQQKRLDLKKKYDLIFRKILPLKKLAHFYIAQNQFSRQLIRYRISKGISKSGQR